MADLYDPLIMPPELLKANLNLDRAVKKLYGFSTKITEAELMGEVYGVSGGDDVNKKVYESVINGDSDYNIRFIDFQNLLVGLGFNFMRQKGSHLIYYCDEIKEFVNIQSDGNKAKGYQVRQLRAIILKHGL